MKLFIKILSLTAVFCTLCLLPSISQAQERGYQDRACGFDLNHNGIVGENADCNKICSGSNPSQIISLIDVRGESWDVRQQFVVSGGSNGSGSATNPFNNIKSAIDAVNSTDNMQDVICISGTFRSEPNALRLKGGIDGSYDVAPRVDSNEQYSFKYPTKPFMIVGWDRNGNGIYPPHPASGDTAVIDGGPNNIQMTFGNSGVVSNIELAHFTVKDYGLEAGGDGNRGFFSEIGADDVSHHYFHDLKLVNINKGLGDHHKGGVPVMFNVLGSGNLDYLSVENINCVDCGGGWFLRGGQNPRKSSDKWRMKNMTIKVHACESASTGPCGGESSGFRSWQLGDVWGGLKDLEYIDNVLDCQPEKWPGGSGCIGPSAHACSTGLYVVNNLIKNSRVGIWMETSDYSAAGSTNCTILQRPISDVFIDRNLIYSPTFGDFGIKVFKGSASPWSTIKDMTITNNMIIGLKSGFTAINIDGSHDGACPGGSSNGTVRILNNTLHANTSGSIMSLDKSRSCGLESFEVKNNIFTGISRGKNISVNNANVKNWNANNNIYDPDGTFNWKGSTKSTLATWRSTINGDNNAFMCDGAALSLQNVSSGNGHINQSSCARGSGVRLSSVTQTDFDGETRPSIGSWDIGADQYCDPASTTCFETPDPINQAPQVDVGADLQQTIFDGESASFHVSGFVTDDGLPESSSLTYLWEQISGPAQIVFNGSITSAADMFMSMPGVYEVRLTASDGELSGSDMLRLIVNLSNGDNENPTVLIAEPLNGHTTEESSVLISATAYDNVGVTSVKCNGVTLGLNPMGQYQHRFNLNMGENLITVEASDAAGNKASQTVIVIRNEVPTGPFDGAVTSFTLYNADTESSMGTIQSGMVIDLSKTPHINIQAEVNSLLVQSVKFQVPGNYLDGKIENKGPYTLAGDRNGDYWIWDITPGTYTVTAIPYESDYAKGSSGKSLAKTIEVIRGDENPKDTTAPVVTITSPQDRLVVDSPFVFLLYQVNDDGVVAAHSKGRDLVEGENLLTVSASDLSGNVGSDSVTVIYRPEEPPIKPEENILSNGEFENGKIDWSGFSSRKKLTSDCADEACKGGQTLFYDISGRNLTTTHKILTNIVPGKTYNISADIKTINAQRDVYVQVFFKKKGGATIGSIIKIGNISGTNQWSNYSTGDIVAPAGAVKMKIRVFATRGKGGKAYFDNIKVIER